MATECCDKELAGSLFKQELPNVPSMWSFLNTARYVLMADLFFSSSVWENTFEIGEQIILKPSLASCTKLEAGAYQSDKTSQSPVIWSEWLVEANLIYSVCLGSLGVLFCMNIFFIVYWGLHGKQLFCTLVLVSETFTVLQNSGLDFSTVWQLEE